MTSYEVGLNFEPGQTCDLCADNRPVHEPLREHRKETGHYPFDLGEGPAPGAPEELPCDLCGTDGPAGDSIAHSLEYDHPAINAGSRWQSRAREAAQEEKRRLEEAKKPSLEHRIGSFVLDALIFVGIVVGFILAGAGVVNIFELIGDIFGS